MSNNKLKVRLLGLFACIIVLLFSIQTFAKTYKTNHFKFSVGWLKQYNEEEKKTITELVAKLDDIWTKINELCENELPPKLKMDVKREGLTSRALRKEKKVLINAVKIKRGLRDSLTIVAHETTHIGFYKISKGKITLWKNKFLDEGIAMYAQYLYVDELDQLQELSLKIAKEDLKNGEASLEYLRDWKKNVQDKLMYFSKDWKLKNPDKDPSLDEELKWGVNSYFTSASFVIHIADKYGFPKLVSAVRNIGKGDSQPEAFQNAIGKSLDEIITEWHASLK